MNSPVLTLGAGTRVNFKSKKMARRFTEDLAAINVAFEPLAVGEKEGPAIRLRQRVEVVFKRAVGVAIP